MSRLTPLLVLSLVFFLAHPLPFYIDQNGPFSGVFSVSWLGGFCYSKTGNSPSDKCNEDFLLNTWDGKTFTIHGLWPSGKGTEQLSQFNENDIDDALRGDLQKYWPPSANTRSDDPYFLWRHEYYGQGTSSHGKDFVGILLAKDPAKYSSASPSVLQNAYFQAGIDLYKSYNFSDVNFDLTGQSAQEFRDQKKPKRGRAGSLYKGVYYEVSKSDIATAIGVSEDNFHVKCKSFNGFKNMLTEVKLCYRINYNEGVSFELASCASIQDESKYQLVDACGQNIKLLRYKAPRTEDL